MGTERRRVVVAARGVEMIFLIPARAGSKRLPGKNKRPFCGIPLWQWSYATASRLATKDDSVVVSTNDSDICSIARQPMRPWNLCLDETTTQAVIDHHFFTEPYAAAICLLQPTSPTRRDSLVRKLIEHGGHCRSVTGGAPNGQCYIYRRGATQWIDIETEKGHDIDTLDQFTEAEKSMLERFQ